MVRLTPLPDSSAASTMSSAIDNKHTPDLVHNAKESHTFDIQQVS